MYSLGLDIGTTSISLAVIDEQNHVKDSVTMIHNAFIESPNTWEKIQDANQLVALSIEAVSDMCSKHDISCIGVTGQQHGMAYLDSDGTIVSPLYTWQDARALQRKNGKTYLELIKEKCGCALSAGFGIASHFYNVENDIVPPNAICFATIGDIVAMNLVGGTSPRIDASNAHSFGMFDITTNSFDKLSCSLCGLDSSFLPKMSEEMLAGYYHGIPVATAIGDNQASFIGATGGKDDVILINIGTGGQISLHTNRINCFSQMELRPYPMGGYLLVGASLCGGRTWAMTERFFREAVKEFTGADISAYDGLNRILDKIDYNEDYPHVITCFDGTRNDPQKRGSIENISINNFTPGMFALGILHGMAEELFNMYASCLGEGLAPKTRLIGSGNGLRLNRHLQRITEKTFGMGLTMSECIEEASTGAALYAKQLLY